MPAEFLCEVSIFKDLTDGEIDAIQKLWKVRDIQPRERIVAEGSVMHDFFVICTGVVHVRRMSQGHEMLLARIGAGGFFGEMNLFDDATATASVYSMGEVKIASAPNATLREFMAARPEIGYKIAVRLLSEVSHRLRQTNERLVHSVFWSPSIPFEERH